MSDKPARTGVGEAIISYQLSVVSYQLSVVSYQLSVVSYQLSVISYQLSVTSDFRLPTSDCFLFQAIGDAAQNAVDKFVSFVSTVPLCEFYCFIDRHTNPILKT